MSILPVSYFVILILFLRFIVYRILNYINILFDITSQTFIISESTFTRGTIDVTCSWLETLCPLIKSKVSEGLLLKSYQWTLIVFIMRWTINIQSKYLSLQTVPRQIAVQNKILGDKTSRIDPFLKVNVLRFPSRHLNTNRRTHFLFKFC